MKIKHLTVVVLASFLVACTGTPKRTTRPAEAQAHSFAIYLVTFTPDKPWGPATLGDLATLSLANEPVLSDMDILSYDFANHRMLVKREALARLPQPSVWGAPFVLVADGKRVYLGAFGTVASSYSIPVPTILVDFREFTSWLTIDEGYPTPGFADGPDPRSDMRIRVALGGLRKLK